MRGLVYQINRKPEVPCERGLPKFPVDSVHISSQGVEGDFNHYRRMPWILNKSERALLIYPKEMYEQLQREHWPANPGDLGENITTEGLPYDSFVPGNIWSIGVIEIQISQPAIPCKVLRFLTYVGEEKRAEFAKTLIGRRGWYAKVLKEGMIHKRDLIERIS